MMKMTRTSVRIDTKYAGETIHVKAAIYDKVTNSPTKIITWILPLTDVTPTACHTQDEPCDFSVVTSTLSHEISGSQICREGNLVEEESEHE